MKKPSRFPFAMLISAGALSVAMSAPAVFAEEGHGGRDGRGSDDAVTTTTPGNAVDNDVNDDHGIDSVVTTSNAGALTVLEARNDALDDND